KAGEAVSVAIRHVDLAFDYLPARAATAEETDTADSGLPSSPPPPEPTARPYWQFTATADGGVGAFHLDSLGSPYQLSATALPVFVGAGDRPALITASLAPYTDGTLALTAEVLPAGHVAGLTIVNGAT